MHDLGAPKFEDEFLCYGVVKGDAHRAIPLKDLIEHGLISALTLETIAHCSSDLPEVQLTQLLRRYDERIQTAIRIGQMYGQDFCLPIAAYILSLHTTHNQYSPILTQETIVRELESFPISEEWSDDRTIMQPGFAYTGISPEYAHAGIAIGILRELVLQTQRKLEKQAMQNNKASRKRKMKSANPDEDRQAKKTTRITRSWRSI